MTEEQFAQGYWYATEIKKFADSLGIPFAAKLRKDELERAIKLFLRTGAVKVPTKRNLSRAGSRDVDQGLRLSLPVLNYTNDPETKAFLERESQKITPGLKRKSGSRYRLNRWREEQLTKGNRITYKDLIEQYVKLNQTEGKFQQIRVVCYVNFLSDFLAKEKRATRKQALSAWKELKRLPVEKTYRAWIEHRR
jgi:hypothetical protein